MLNEGWTSEEEALALLCKQWSLIKLFSKHCCEVLSKRQTNAGGMSSKVHWGVCSYAASMLMSFQVRIHLLLSAKEAKLIKVCLYLLFRVRYGLAWARAERWERREGYPRHEMLTCRVVPDRTNEREGETALIISTLLSENSHLIFRLRTLRIPTWSSLWQQMQTSVGTPCSWVRAHLLGMLQ